MPDRRWVLTGSDARSPMSLDVVAESGPILGLGEHVEVMTVREHEEIMAREMRRTNAYWATQISPMGRGSDA